jgi:hypothetical protein
MSNAIAFLDESSASDWSRTLYAFLAEKERRSGSLRTVQSYSRMLNDFFGRVSRTPDQINGQDEFRLGLRHWALRQAAVLCHDRRRASLPQFVLQVLD